MKQQVRSRRLGREHARLLVGEALRNVAVGKVEFLEYSPLCEELEIEGGRGMGYWPRGDELASLVREAGQRVLDKLAGVARYENQRQLLAAMLEGTYPTIASYARAHGVSREYVSRTTFRQVAKLLARELGMEV